MAFVREVRRGKKVYYYLVESIREGKTVRQKHLKYLGTTKPTVEAVQRIMRELGK